MISYLNPIRQDFCPENSICILCLTHIQNVYIQVHYGHDFIMEANTMNPDQTAPLGAV